MSDAGWSRSLEGITADGTLASGETIRVADSEEGRIVGFISVGPATDDDAPTHRQLQALNVVAEHHGTGLAQRLITDVLGDGPAYLLSGRGERASDLLLSRARLCRGWSRGHRRA